MEQILSSLHTIANIYLSILFFFHLLGQGIAHLFWAPKGFQPGEGQRHWPIKRLCLL